MALVDYSDSDASDEETVPSVKLTVSSKPTFQRVVDRSNPGKIKISLPQPTRDSIVEGDEPPSKRPKIGGGGLSGFMASLPAPKRTGISTNSTLGGGNTAKRGLGAGVNLKTGAAPGFSREPEPDRDYNGDAQEEVEPISGDLDLNLSVPKTASNMGNPAEEVKLVGKSMMFKPLSVSRKPVKKKKAMASTLVAATVSLPSPVTPNTPQNLQKPVRAKVSMFSLSTETPSSEVPKSAGNYEPMMYQVPDEVEEATGSFEGSFEESAEYTPNTSFAAPPAVPTPPVSQSLNDIAGDLNLSAAERRQLFGRGHKGGRVTNVINFNTDQEYLHNEELRAAGEQVAHNPVRAIAAGKHSLKQLVNSAQSQKEALEESFAKGKNNRAEASSRYGW